VYYRYISNTCKNQSGVTLGGKCYQIDITAKCLAPNLAVITRVDCLTLQNMSLFYKMYYTFVLINKNEDSIFSNIFFSWNLHKLHFFAFKELLRITM